MHFKWMENAKFWVDIFQNYMEDMHLGPPGINLHYWPKTFRCPSLSASNVGRYVNVSRNCVFWFIFYKIFACLTVSAFHLVIMQIKHKIKKIRAIIIFIILLVIF